jgi:TM2 domain-containing membrane protein YozV
MNLKETIYLSLAAVAVVIGIHRTMLEESVQEGILYNYWIFMGGIIFLLLYRSEVQKTPPPPREKKKKRPQQK